MQKTLKKFFLAFMILELALAYAPAFAQQAQFDYAKQAGVADQIRQYLCAPTPVPVNQTQFGSGGNPITFSQREAAAANANKNDLYICINKLYKFAIIIASVVGVFFIVIAGYVYMSAEGNQEQVEKAKNILVTTLTSIVILLAGFVLLKAINPNLVEFRSIQPESVKPSEVPTWESLFDSAGRILKITSPEGDFTPLGNNDVSAVKDAGCSFQSTKFEPEINGIQTELFNAVVQICQAAALAGKIQISSVASGSHAIGSYHYKFCAVDFADGSGNFLSSAAGKAAKAKADQLKILRVNPGVDASTDDHMHIDLGSSCKN